MLRSLLRRGFGIVPLLLIVAIVAAAGVYFVKTWNADNGGPVDGPFQIADFTNRDFEGSPALALSFTHPMDARKGFAVLSIERDWTK